MGSADLSGICWDCGYQAGNAAGPCPRCGHRLQSLREVRIRGCVLAALGALLLASMIALMIVTSRIMLRSGQPGATAHFEGGAAGAAAVFVTLSLIGLFGLASLGSGLWLLKYGKRNKVMLKFAFGLWAAFVLIGLAVDFLD